MSALLRRRIGTVAAILFVMMATVLAPSTAAAKPAVTASSIESVRIAYREFAKLQQVPSGWTGATAGCRAGAVKEAYQDAMLRRINIVRGLGALEPVTFDAHYSSKAQQAALMMGAARDLQHYPDSNWPCYAPAGAEAARNSNLSLGGSDHIENYMDDAGPENGNVGHRRWILHPSTKTMGAGSTDISNALWVISGNQDNPAGPSWVGWPAAGFFPQQLLPHRSGRWSLSADDRSTDFSRATVSLTGPAGPVAVRATATESGYGNDTLVWNVPELPVVNGGGVVTYTVAVGNIIRNGETLAHTYEVKLIDGNWVDVYVTPGTHHINGRDWRTACSLYSSTVDRCRTEIWATTATDTGGNWVQTNGWVFNNLTYKPSPRGNWQGNPLATPGTHIVNGRLWRTQCDNAWTGRNACRSEIWATVVAYENGAYRHKTTWVFNNIAIFRP
ncbi:MAG: CAP domain-containing protein [Arachnia sp.]